MSEWIMPWKFYDTAKRKYIINSTKDFIGKEKAKEVSNGYRIVSFDVKSLSNNVLLD